jgi:hypothetical protein
MDIHRSAVNAGGNGRFEANQLCSLLDTLVAMRWDLNQCLRADPDLPVTITLHLLRVGSELDGSINVLKMFIGDDAASPQGQAHSSDEK